MRLSAIALKIRQANTRFGNKVGGAVELAVALKGTLRGDMAFIIPLGEDADRNTSNVVQQNMIERFAVIIALVNDSEQKDKLGIKAYDEVHDVREEIFSAILNFDLGFETVISYRGGSIVNLDSAYLWYQFEFDYTSMIVTDSDTGQVEIPERAVGERQQVSQLDDFNTIYTQYVLNPSVNQRTIDKDPHLELPVEASLVDMTTIVDLTDDPRAGGFTGGFGSAFDYYDKDRTKL